MMSSSSSSSSVAAAMDFNLEKNEGRQRAVVTERSASPTSVLVPPPSRRTSVSKQSQPNAVPVAGRAAASIMAALVWPLIVSFPLVMTWKLGRNEDGGPRRVYHVVFPSDWYYEVYQPGNTPKPLGLTLGILAVAVGQLFVLTFFACWRNFGSPRPIQCKGARVYDFYEGLSTHLSQPEGFALLVAYLSITWMCNLMPSSYYNFDGSIQWHYAAACLVCQDGFQYAMHLAEHKVSPLIYQKSHKPHHFFTNPRLFDAFNGSTADTILMILIPLFATAHVVPFCNVWTYMTFGSLYANWLTLIHSEYTLPWDGIFRRLRLGTPADHHVHHKLFHYNYGHLCLWYDCLAGTYRNPQQLVGKYFNEGV